MANKPLIALSFDDGVDPVNTPIVLDKLDNLGIKATFFVCGQTIAGNEDLLLRIHDEGHTIGNHSWSHPDFQDNFPGLDPYWGPYDEIANTNTAIYNVTGVTPILFRFPYGHDSYWGNEVVRDLGMWDVMWHWDYSPTGFTGDWEHTNSQADLIDYVEGNAVDQAIILLHDGGDAANAPSGFYDYLDDIHTSLSPTYDFGVVDIAWQANPVNQYSWVEVVP